MLSYSFIGFDGRIVNTTLRLFNLWPLQTKMHISNTQKGLMMKYNSPEDRGKKIRGESVKLKQLSGYPYDTATCVHTSATISSR